MEAYYTIGFNKEERAELLEIFKDNSKWRSRVEGSHAILLSDWVDVAKTNEKNKQNNYG